METRKRLLSPLWHFGLAAEVSGAASLFGSHAQPHDAQVALPRSLLLHCMCAHLDPFHGRETLALRQTVAYAGHT